VNWTWSAFGKGCAAGMAAGVVAGVITRVALVAYADWWIQDQAQGRLGR